MELPDNLGFLKAPRFYVMLLGTFAVYLESKGWIGASERNLIATISALFVGVQTFDRAAEKVGRTEVDAKEEVKEVKKEVEKEKGVK